MNGGSARPEELLAHDAFVRRLARGLVADAQRAEDLAQSALAAGLEGAPRGPALRSWLATVTRRLAARERRGERRRAARERAVARPEATFSVAELVARESLRRRVIETLLALEEPYRSTLVLRFYEGLPPRRIAQREGVPVETVRTRARRGLAMLRARLDREVEGGSAAWSALLLPLATAPSPATLEVAREVVLEVLAMSTKAKVVAAACALAAVAVVVASSPQRWRSTHPAPAEAPQPAAFAEADAGGPEGESGAPLAAPVQTADRTAMAAPPEAERARDGIEPFGTLELRVVSAADGAPRPGEWLRVEPTAVADPAFQAFELRADNGGRARIERVPAGKLLVSALRGGWAALDLAPGETLVHTLEVPRGFDVRGVVVDGEGAPVSGAEIWLSQKADHDWYHVVAHSDRDGTFHLAGLSGLQRLGARSERHAPSASVYVTGPDGGEQQVRLELGGPSGRVTGRVWSPAGEPVAGALVRVARGEDPAALVELGVGGIPPPFIDTSTDEEGRFALDGLALGESQLAARAAGFAIWLGAIEVVEGRTAQIDVTLAPGAMLAGVARDSAGEPAGGVRISDRPRWRGKLGRAVQTAPDGSFRLEHLGPGEVRLRADGGDRGRAEILLHALPGQVLAWDPVLSTGLELRGRVVVLDELGEPFVAKLSARLLSIHDSQPVGEEAHFDHQLVDAEGRFAFANLRDRTYRLEVSAPGSFTPLLVRSVRPGDGDVLLRVPHHLLPSAVVTGRLVDAHGEPARGVRVLLSRDAATGWAVHHPDPETGIFETSPIVPGTWAVEIEDDSALELRFGPRSLSAGERWDLGTIELGASGALLARWRRAPGAPADPPGLRIIHAGRRSSAGLELEGDSARAAALAPGAYGLQVSGEGFASALHPFEIRAGEETALELLLEPGVPCRIRVELAQEDLLHGHVHLVLARLDGTPVVQGLVGRKLGEPWQREYHLAPGTYEAVARLVAGEPRTARASFSVEESSTSTPEILITIE